MKAPPKFPMPVRSGSAIVTIYRVHHRVRGERFTLTWHEGSERRTQQFADLGRAREAATTKADQLARGDIEAAGWSVAERDEYRAAKAAADGVPLVTALREWGEARKLTGAGSLIAACRSWAERHERDRSLVTVAEAARRFLTAKKADGVDTRAGYARTLPGLVAALGSQPIATVGPDAIAGYLSRFTNAGSRNSHRKRIVALWRWCRRRGLLPLDVLTAAERTDAARGHRTTISLVAPARLAEAFALIAAKSPDYLPALTVASMAGLRRSEVHGQRWEDVDLERGFLRVTAAKPNTPARRLVPLGGSALAWLTPRKQDAGPICDNLAIDRVRDICRTAKLPLAKNGLRHSWISARVEISGDIPRTSIEAGNTPTMIHRHYRQLMRREDAEAWFAITPAA